MQLPWVFVFWMMVAAYVVHVLDESLLGGSFVEKVKEHWWPEYSWTKFFWFNAVYFIIMIASVVFYDLFEGFWIILPLAWLIERACNGLWHLWWTVHFHEYSPGLVSSILMWMNLYFAIRYTPTLPTMTEVDPLRNALEDSIALSGQDKHKEALKLIDCSWHPGTSLPDMNGQP